MNIHFRACAQSVRHQHVHDLRRQALSLHLAVEPLVNRSVDNVLFKVKPSLHQAFSQIIDVVNLCFVHELLRNTQ